MTLSITELNASTEELEQALAGLLVHAREEVLSDTEVQILANMPRDSTALLALWGCRVVGSSQSL
jgi:hypothetical protein